MYKKILSILLITIITMNVAVFGQSVSDINLTNKDPNLIYQGTDDIEYSIYKNHMIDTYIIAAALSMDFNSSIIVPYPDNNQAYQSTKEYFMPYKNHPFIKSFDNYVYGNDINGDAIGVLLTYSPTPELKKLYPVNATYRQWTFKEEEIQKFIEGLRAFYNDTNAEDFFEEMTTLEDDMKSYISSMIEDTHYISLIQKMELYLGNKEMKFGKKSVVYESVLTPFRPGMASFFIVETEDEVKIISYQSLNDFSKNPNKFDIQKMVKDMVHEFIHTYINDGVKALVVEKYGDELEAGKSLLDGGMYGGMPLYRQADEYFVRAIEARLYSQVYNESYAQAYIMKNEIEYGGFNQLECMYDMLEKYEDNRFLYQSIDKYFPKVLDTLMLYKDN